MLTTFLSRRAALAAGARTLVAGMAGVTVAELSSATARPSSGTATDAWLRKLDVKHKMLFDSPDANGGVGLAHLLDYYHTYNTAYGVPDTDIRGLFTLYGGTTAYALNDAAWTKHRIGELLGIQDPVTGQTAGTNLWRRDFVYRGRPLPGASVEALQQRGAIFLVCNGALINHGRRMAQANGGDAGEVYEELKANVLPGVEVVPSMIVAVEQAHQAGVAYQRK